MNCCLEYTCVWITDQSTFELNCTENVFQKYQFSGQKSQRQKWLVCGFSKDVLMTLKVTIVRFLWRMIVTLNVVITIKHHRGISGFWNLVNQTWIRIFQIAELQKSFEMIPNSKQFPGTSKLKIHVWLLHGRLGGYASPDKIFT